jgi:hypothetical protein
MVTEVLDFLFGCAGQVARRLPVVEIPHRVIMKFNDINGKSIIK